jgi:hypothetical protein
MAEQGGDTWLRILGLAGGLLVSGVAIATDTGSTPYSVGGHLGLSLAVELAAGWSLMAAGALAHPQRTAASSDSPYSPPVRPGSW